MGQKISESISLKEEKLTRNRFEFMNIIGRGGFGKVWKVIEKKYKIIYAMKEMQKVKVIDKKSINSIKNEREMLSYLKHPFIVNMHFSFQDYDNLYLVLDYLQGGDLRYHVSRHRKFSEEQTRFFIACIIIALEYIHANSIIHRDIKPENLVFDDKGYLRLTDFGIAKKYSPKNSHETSGTPGYMSPEVMKGANHSYGVDYFAVGVIGYEFMLGRRPYIGKTRKEIKEQMMTKQVQIQYEELPEGWSDESMDFINKLLQRKPEQRLGYNQESEIKEHPWLKFYPWEDLIQKRLQSPFLLDKNDNYDKRYCEQPDKIGLDTQNRYDDYKNQEDFNTLFENFTYCYIEVERTKQQTQLKEKMKIKGSKQHSKHHSKSTIAFSRQENHNQESNNYTINSNANHQQLINTNATSTTNKSNKAHLQSMTINLLKNDIPLKIIKTNVNLSHRYSGSFHSQCNMKTPNKDTVTMNQKNKKEIEMGNNAMPPRKFTRSVSNLSSSPYSDTRAIEYIKKTKDNTKGNSNNGYRASLKSFSDLTENSAKKYSVLSSANKRPLKRKNGCSGIPYNYNKSNNSNKKQIPKHKVDVISHHNKNITSQCTPMISTNCTIYPTKKVQHDKIILSNISSVVNSLIKDYKMNFHSRSLSSSKLQLKTTNKEQNVNRKVNNHNHSNNRKIRKQSKEYVK